MQSNDKDTVCQRHAAPGMMTLGEFEELDHPSQPTSHSSGIKKYNFFCQEVWGFTCSSFLEMQTESSWPFSVSDVGIPVVLQTPYQENASHGIYSLLRNLLIRKMYCCSEAMYGKGNLGLEVVCHLAHPPH